MHIASASKINSPPTEPAISPQQKLVRHLPGILVSAGIAVAAIALGRLPWLQDHGLSALTLAIVLGMLLGNSLYPRMSAVCGHGVGFSKQSLLRLGVILYGLRLTFQDIGHVGLVGGAIDALMLSSTFGLAMYVGVRLLRMDRDTVILIGAGNSICGAAAVLATEPVLRAKSEQVAIAVSTVVVFGTLAIFVYPMLYRLALAWPDIGVTASQFGIYAGSTIHEVAQVVAASRMISEETANAAVIAKMVRVMMLAPFLLVLSAYLASARAKTSQSAHSGHRQARGGVVIPWFAFAFIGVVCLHSLVVIPQPMVAALLDIDTLMLAMAMAALGVTTHVSVVRSAGFKPMVLATLLFVWLIVGGAFVNRGVMALWG